MEKQETLHSGIFVKLCTGDVRQRDKTRFIIIIVIISFKSITTTNRYTYTDNKQLNFQFVNYLIMNMFVSRSI